MRSLLAGLVVSLLPAAANATERAPTHDVGARLLAEFRGAYPLQAPRATRMPRPA